MDKLGFARNQIIKSSYESQAFFKELVSTAGLEGKNLPDIELPRNSYTDREVIEKIFKYMSCGKSFEAACGLMGVDRRNLTRHIAKNPDLDEAYTIAQQLRIAWWEDVLVNSTFPPLIAVATQILKAANAESYTGITSLEPTRSNVVVKIQKTIIDGGKTIDGEISNGNLARQIESGESSVSGLEASKK